MKIFDANVSGSLNVSGSARFFGDLTVDGTINAAISGQPIEIATGPPLFHACANVVKQPARIEIIENEIAKLEKPLHERSSSCL